jgi:hypothetical protein
MSSSHADPSGLGSYDMILLPPPRDNDNGGRQPARERRNRRCLSRVAKEQHPSLSCHLPRQRGRRRGNHGQAGGGASSAVEGHELDTPKTELHPGLERLLETPHLELDGKLFVNTQQAPTWRANCRRFDPRGPWTNE